LTQESDSPTQTPSPVNLIGSSTPEEMEICQEEIANLSSDNRINLNFETIDQNWTNNKKDVLIIYACAGGMSWFNSKLFDRLFIKFD